MGARHGSWCSCPLLDVPQSYYSTAKNRRNDRRSSNAYNMLKAQCANGCTLSPVLVCGADDITYMGSCFAVCHGVPIAHTGACELSDPGTSV